MEWVLVLVFTIGSQTVSSTIPGHKSEAACLASRANAVKAFAKQANVKETTAADVFIASFCFEKKAG